MSHDYKQLVKQARGLLRNWRDEVPVHVRRAAPLLAGLADAVEELQKENRVLTANLRGRDLIVKRQRDEARADRSVRLQAALNDLLDLDAQVESLAHDNANLRDDIETAEVGWRTQSNKRAVAEARVVELEAEVEQLQQRNKELGYELAELEENSEYISQRLDDLEAKTND